MKKAPSTLYVKALLCRAEELKIDSAYKQIAMAWGMSTWNNTDHPSALRRRETFEALNVDAVITCGDG